MGLTAHSINTMGLTAHTPQANSAAARDVNKVAGCFAQIEAQSTD
jgi:hypothetical protein